MLAARVLFPAPPEPSIATSTVPGLLRRIFLMRSTTSGRAASSGMHRVSRPEQPGSVRGSPERRQGLECDPAPQVPRQRSHGPLLRAVGSGSNLRHAPLRAGWCTSRPPRPGALNVVHRDDSRGGQRQGHRITRQDRVGRQDRECPASNSARSVHARSSAPPGRRTRQRTGSVRTRLSRSRVAVLLGGRQAAGFRHHHATVQAACRAG